MTPVDRRTFLKGAAGAAAVTAAGSALTGPAFSAALALEPDAVFQYGVASGDPLPDGVVLWTRVTPVPEATPGSGLGDPTAVRWVVADDPALRRVVRSGTARTTSAADHTVKVDVRGLRPGTGYFYGFFVADTPSPVGTTRTAPATDADNAQLRFGMVSCSNFTGGFFSAYRLLAERDDLDFVLHLGDYLYEYGNGEDRYGPESLRGVRDHDPAVEMVTLSDYRRRHAQYKADPDLAALHRKYAFVTTWDDHEVTNDSWRDGAENHQDGEGPYVPRRNRSYQAYDEWMPIRLPEARSEQETRIYRRLRFGTLADLTMLDLRQYRDQQVPATDGAAIDAPDRQMTGPEQQAFLEQGLADPDGPSWRLFGNSVQIMQVTAPPLPAALAGALAQLQGAPAPVPTLPQSGFALLVDPWDGYTANRQRVLDFALASGVGDPVFLTGDIHSTWAADLPIDPGTYTGTPTDLSPSAGIEFVCTSVTSDNLDEIVGSPPRTTSIAVEQAIRAVNRHIKEVEFDSHGYSVVDVTRETIQCDWFYVSDRTDPEATQAFAVAFSSRKGSRTVVRSAAPIRTDRSDREAQIPAPATDVRAQPAGTSRQRADLAPAALPATGPSDTLPLLGGVVIGAVAAVLRLRSRGSQAPDS